MYRYDKWDSTTRYGAQSLNDNSLRVYVANNLYSAMTLVADNFQSRACVGQTMQSRAVEEYIVVKDMVPCGHDAAAGRAVRRLARRSATKYTSLDFDLRLCG